VNFRVGGAIRYNPPVGTLEFPTEAQTAAPVH
jgi:hypothetical protein